MDESPDDEPYGIPIGLPREMWPEPMPTIEEQQRRAGEAFYFGLRAAQKARNSPAKR